MTQQFARMGLTGIPQRFDGEDDSYVDPNEEKYGVGAAYKYTADDYSNTPVEYQHTDDIYANGSSNEGVSPYIVGAGKPGETYADYTTITKGLVDPYAVGAKPGETPVGSSAISNDALGKLETIKAENSDIWSQLTKLPG